MDPTSQTESRWLDAAKATGSLRSSGKRGRRWFCVPSRHGTLAAILHPCCMLHCYIFFVDSNPRFFVVPAQSSLVFQWAHACGPMTTMMGFLRVGNVGAPHSRARTRETKTLALGQKRIIG